MSMYAKLFTSIYQGTLRGNSHGLLVFTNLLAHADKEGIVDMHPRAIAEEVGLTVDEVKAALAVLEAPDDESRSPEEEGRRIVRLDEHRAWGWRVVNYLKYRSIRNEDDRREQNREAQERWRNKKKAEKSATVSHDKPQSAYTEAEAKEETSEAIASGAAAPVDKSTKTKSELWRAGKSLLAEQGMPKDQCGSFVGKLVKDYGDEVTVEAVRATVFAQPPEAREYLIATCQRLTGERKPAAPPLTVVSDADKRTAEYLAEQSRHAAEAKTTGPPLVLAEVKQRIAQRQLTKTT